MNNPDLNNITITNFQPVNNWLYRGGQPKSDEFCQLNEFGIKSIISFRYNSKVMQWEKSLCKSYDLNYFPIPLNYIVQPNKQQIKKFFDILDNVNFHSIYVHCKHGCDRTGLLIAMYRIVYDHFSFYEAYQEMVDLGFHKIKMHHFKWILKTFAQKQFPLNIC